MVAPGARFTRRHPCPICKGGHDLPQGQGKRCYGFVHDDGGMAFCTREDLAGPLDAVADAGYPHALDRPCKCGADHRAGAVSPRGSPPPWVLFGLASEAVYPYRDAHGIERYQIGRFLKDGKKTFRPRRPKEGGGWELSLTKELWLPYRLPEVIAARAGTTIWIVEGEKDVETMERLGHVATTNPFGKGKWAAIHGIIAPYLAGRDVRIIADRDADDGGLKHARDVAKHLKGVARSIVVLMAPAPHKDVSDLAGVGGSLDQLKVIDDADAFHEDVPDTEVKRRFSVVSPPGWRHQLVVTKKGKVENTAFNAHIVLINHEEWQGVIRYDSFSEAVVKSKCPPWDIYDRPPGWPEPSSWAGEWRDTDTCRVQSWLHRHEGIKISVTTAECAVQVAAEFNSFHPVREYLESCKWDGRQRLPAVLPDYFGAEDTEYTRAVGVRWMIACVARVMRPGCQSDHVMVLEGLQGIGKSTALRALVPVRDWYADTGVNIGDKDSLQNIRGVWIYCLDELASAKRADVEKLKSWLTATSDRYRPSFGRRARTFERQTVFCGTTNKDAYLTDVTGNRRFLPIRCVRAPNLAAIKEFRDQLWAEARTRWESGESWWVDSPSLAVQAAREQHARVVPDEVIAIISAWLERPVMWQSSMPVDVSEGVTLRDVCLHAMGIPFDRLADKRLQGQAADALRALGFERARAWDRGDNRGQVRWVRAQTTS